MTIDKATADRWLALQTECGELETSIRPQIEAIRATIEPRASDLALEISDIEGEHGEIQTCEACGAPHTFEDLNGTGDGYFCDACCGFDPSSVPVSEEE
jgi:hypothetical protein